MRLQDLIRDAEQVHAPWTVGWVDANGNPQIYDCRNRLAAVVRIAGRGGATPASETLRDAEAMCRIVNSIGDVCRELERLRGGK